MQLVLPDTPDIVLIGLALGNGKVAYKESRTVWIGKEMEEVLPFLWNRQTLLLRLVRGGTTEDLALPVGGFDKANDHLFDAALRLRARDQQRVFDAMRGH
jgi:hypothetical protein